MIDNRPTAAEMRVMRAEAARVRGQQEEREPARVVDLPQQRVDVERVAS